MNKEDQQFDNYVKESINSNSFVYNPTYFKEVETMLKPAKVKKLWGAWISIAALVVIGFVTALLLDQNVKGPVMGAKSFSQTIKLGSNQVAKLESLNLRILNKKESLENQSNSQATALGENIGESTNNAKTQILAGETRISPWSLKKEEIKFSESKLKTNQGKVDKKTLIGLNERRDAELVEDLLFKALMPVDYKSTSLKPNFSVKEPRRKTKSYFVTANGMLGTAYTESVSTLTKSAGLGVGFNQYKGNWGWSIAVLGEIQSTNLNFIERTKHYGYDVTHFENKLNYSSLYRAELPIWLHYKKEIHNAHFGVSVKHMLNSKLEYIYKVNNQVQRDEIVYGQNRGLSKTLVSLQAGYGVNITRRLELGMNVAVALNSEVKKNNEANSKVSPLSGQLYLRHAIR